MTQARDPYCSSRKKLFERETKFFKGRKGRLNCITLKENQHVSATSEFLVMNLQKPSPKFSSLNKIAPKKHTINHIICTVKVLFLSEATSECSSTSQEKNVIYGSVKFYH